LLNGGKVKRGRPAVRRDKVTPERRVMSDVAEQVRRMEESDAFYRRKR
jgi:hypothetical protein